MEGESTVHDLLSYLYVLLRVLDDEKHYYAGDDEVEKLLRHGEGWLGQHPERQLIVSRYLKRRSSLTDQAFARLLDDENPEVEAAVAEAKLLNGGWLVRVAISCVRPPQNFAHPPDRYIAEVEFV